MGTGHVARTGRDGLFAGEDALRRAVDASLAGRRALALESGRELLRAERVLAELSGAAAPGAAHLGGEPHGALVIVAVDDPRAITAGDEPDSRVVAISLGIPVLEPATVVEARDHTALGFELAARFGTPVLLRATTTMWRGRAEVPVAALAALAAEPVAPSEAASEDVEQALRSAADRNAQVIERHAELAIITAGVPYQLVCEAFPAASILKLGLTNPLPSERIRRFAIARETIVVIEEAGSFLEDRIREFRVPLARRRVLRSGELSVELLRGALS